MFLRPDAREAVVAHGVGVVLGGDVTEPGCRGQGGESGGGSGGRVQEAVVSSLTWKLLSTVFVYYFVSGYCSKFLLNKKSLRKH